MSMIMRSICLWSDRLGKRRGGEGHTVLVVSPPAKPWRQAAARCWRKLPEIPAHIVANSMIKVQRRNTGLLPTASDSGIHKKAEMPMIKVGAESRASSGNGFMS